MPRLVLVERAEISKAKEVFFRVYARLVVIYIRRLAQLGSHLYLAQSVEDMYTSYMERATEDATATQTTIRQNQLPNGISIA